MSEASRTGGLEAALANGWALLPTDPAAAAEQAGEILRVSPDVRDALQLMAAALRRLGRPAQAEQADLRAVALFARDPVLAEAASHLNAGRLNPAEKLLRPHLRRKPHDLAAKAMLAEILVAIGVLGEAEALFREILTLTPSFVDAWLGLSNCLFQDGRVADSLAALEGAFGAEPGNPAAAQQKGATLGHLGEYSAASKIYEELLKRDAGSVATWIAYGNVLKTMGRQEEAVGAYRHALHLKPGSGEAWWSLANLKAVKLEDSDLAAMEKLFGRAELSVDDRFHLHFALGQALEDKDAHEDAFRHYSEANRLRRLALPYDPKEVAEEVERSKALFTPAFFEARGGWGCETAEAIFILGMPRAGSTLVEQILASHSAVEGTAELPYVGALARALVAERWATSEPYPDLLAKLSRDRFASLGQAYLDRARVHRKTAKARFIDKMPNNWSDVGLIHLILPNAKIVDVRRDPMGCGFSNYKQHYAQGQAFSYSLEDMGAYYRHYVDLMGHFDRVLPGRVHHLLYEDLVADPEAEVRRLLAYLGLPFEEQAMRFHENKRAVRTASSEQVRRPINRSGLDQWRPFEPWLGPLKTALGPALENWRGPGRPQ